MSMTPRNQEELKHWTEYLSECEEKVSAAVDPFDAEHWKHQAHYSSQKILMIEDQIYGIRGTS